MLKHRITLPLTRMFNRLKKYISLIILAAFLFPLIVEHAHSFQHHNENLCIERQTLHFHQTEHHCLICDYIPAAKNEPDNRGYSLLTFAFSDHFPDSSPCFAANQYRFHYSLRAPPFIT